MAIVILNSRPLNSLNDNLSEALNEMVIIIICYHLMVISDFVPFYERDLKQIFSYAMISVICVTTFVYILIIIVSTFMILFNTLKTKYEKN